jgi:hypothetical protein
MEDKLAVLYFCVNSVANLFFEGTKKPASWRVYGVPIRLITG